MARRYSGKKGKHGSKKPARKIVPSWVKYKPFEVEKLVLKLAKEGKTCAQIGTILRDTYGIPSVKAITGKKISKILKENNLLPKVPDDLAALIKRVIKINEHIQKNKHDMTAKRGLILIESKIKRLVKYYKNKGVLPQEWTYSTEQAKFLIK